MEQWIERETVFEGVIFDVHCGRVRLDDGVEARREMVEHGGGVGVAPFDGERVYLVRQYRICIDDYILEIPAGRLEPGEDPMSAGLRELEEEIGKRAGELVPLGHYYVSPGFTSERDYLFLGLDLTDTEQNLEHDERVEIVPMTLDEVEARLQDFAFPDMKTTISLRALLEHVKKS